MSPARYVKTWVAGRAVDLHRHLMEQSIGRKLGRFEIVHHVNGDPQDNRLENLSVVSIEEHQRIHLLKHPLVKDCEACGSPFTTPSGNRRQRACSKACGYVLRSRAMLNRRAS